MKDEQTPLTKTTLQKIIAEFPTHEWSDRELEELVAPKYGIITGFQKLNADTRELLKTDLKDIEPAGKLPGDME